MFYKSAFLLVVACLVGCGYDPVYEADESDDASSRNVVVEKQPAVKVQMSDGAFRSAAQKGQADKVQQGIDGQVDIDGSDPSDSMTALHLAAHDGRKHVVQLLLDRKATIDIRDGQGHTPLLMAAYNGHTDIVKLLHQSDAEIDAKDSQGMTPLIHASSGPYVETVRYLIDSGAEINAIDTG
jgi:ankyrin repeat protein